MQPGSSIAPDQTKAKNTKTQTLVGRWYQANGTSWGLGERRLRISACEMAELCMNLVLIEMHDAWEATVSRSMGLTCRVHRSVVRTRQSLQSSGSVLHQIWDLPSDPSTGASVSGAAKEEEL